MPSVYLASYNSAKPLPVFVSKKVPFLMPGAVGEVRIIVNEKVLPMSASIMIFILNVIYTKVSMVAKGFLCVNLFKPITSLSTVFNVPICTFMFKNLSPQEIAELKAMGLTQDVASKNLFVGAPASHFLPRIAALNPVDGRMRPGQVDYDGFFAWVYLMKGIHLFTTAKSNMGTASLNSMFKQNQITKGKTSGPTMSMTGELVTCLNTTDYDLAPHENQYFITAPSTDLSAFKGSFTDISAIGTTDSNGIFFPFFIGMNTVDKDTCARVFSRFFHGALSIDMDASNRLMAKVASGNRGLAFSEAGIVLSHIYRVMEIGWDINPCKIHIITKGSNYLGTVLEGDFSVTMYGEVYTSGPVLEEIGKVDLLDSQAERVVGLLNGIMGSDGGQVHHFVKTDFLSSRIALNSFNSVDPADTASSDVLEQVRDIMSEMEFGDMFPPVTQANLLDCITYMSTGIFAGISKYPAYLGGGVLHNRGRYFEALSMYGPRVPSLNIGDGKSGTTIVFPGVGKEDKNLVKIQGVRPLAYFPFWLVPINVAGAQWAKIFSSGSFNIPSGRKNKKEFTDLHRVVVSVSADPAFTSIYDMLKNMVNETRASGSTNAKGKRKRGDDDDGAKGKRTKGKDLDDI